MSFANITNRTRWSRDEDDYLVATYGQMPVKHIAVALPMRSMGAIRRRAEYLGLKGRGNGFRAKPQDVRDRVLLLSAQGLTTYAIAQEVGASQAWVHNVIKANATYHNQWLRRQSERRSDGIAQSWSSRHGFRTFDDIGAAIDEAAWIAGETGVTQVLVRAGTKLAVMSQAKANSKNLETLETVSSIKEAA